MNTLRYVQQILLPQVGMQGQQQLAGARVLVAGAGGLGCHILQQLAATGIGYIGIADADTISISNLHRQILYTAQDVGSLKALTAADRLRTLNPEITIQTHALHLANHNAYNIIRDYDIVADGTDNIASRYLLSDVCRLQQKPLVYGSIDRFEAQIAVFSYGTPAVTYRDLFPQPVHAVPDCSMQGVLPPLPAITGSMQALEVMKIILRLASATPQLICYQALTHHTYQIALQPHPAAMNNAPQTPEEIITFNYHQPAPYCYDS